MKRRLTVAAVITVLVAGFVFLLYQPWLTQWGSTVAEQTAPMAGDSLVVGGRRWTRSVTIDVPPERVWPWLVQVGVDKGGFYTFDWAENLFGDPIHNADRIHPEWQNLRPGDAVWPASDGDPRIADVVAAPGLLVLSGDQGNWSWATTLQPVPGGRTRVVTRMLSTAKGQLGPLLDPADLIVFPRVLVGLKQRAEGTLPGMPGTFVGAPLPGARLPVAWWTALAWLVALAGFAVTAARPLAFGRLGARRPHPGIVAGIGFIAGGRIPDHVRHPADRVRRPPLACRVGPRRGARYRLRCVAGAGAWWRVPASRRQAAAGAHRGRSLPAASGDRGVAGRDPVRLDRSGARSRGRRRRGGDRGRRGGGNGVVARPPLGGVLIAAVLSAGYAVSGSALVVLAGALVIELVAGRARRTLNRPTTLVAQPTGG
jgi:hypothetical protein